MVCAGMVCFVAGALCYVKSQPRGVWIPSFMIVGGVSVVFVVLVVQSTLRYGFQFTFIPTLIVNAENFNLGTGIAGWFED